MMRNRGMTTTLFVLAANAKGLRAQVGTPGVAVLVPAGESGATRTTFFTHPHPSLCLSSCS